MQDQNAADASQEDDGVVQIREGSEATDDKMATTKSFIIEWDDQESGNRYVGTITVQRPNIGMIGKMGVMKARLNGGLQVDAITDFYHEMLSTMQVVTTEAPAWWKPETFYDPRPLRKMWDHVRLWSESFRNRVEQRFRAAAVAGGKPTRDAVAPAVVVQEVQPTAQRSAAG